MNNILKDYTYITDKIGKQPKTLWAKTQIIGGYGLHKNLNGISELDEVVFETSNMVPIGGVQYAMSKMFGVNGPLSIPTLNSSMQIGSTNSSTSDEKICLFGVGIGGAASNNLTALDVKYTETNVSDIVPLRYTNDILTTEELNMYFGKKMVNGVQAYYLKKFNTDPEIHHFYKNGEEYEDGEELNDSSIIFDSSTEFPIESFTEVALTISKKDVREWFEESGNIEQCRINSIGLFTAAYDKVSNDYTNIRLFSKLNIPTEPLSLAKDMNILYRVYGA